MLKYIHTFVGMQIDNKNMEIISIYYTDNMYVIILSKTFFS